MSFTSVTKFCENLVLRFLQLACREPIKNNYLGIQSLQSAEQKSPASHYLVFQVEGAFLLRSEASKEPDLVTDHS